jgi:hypothetical protein
MTATNPNFPAPSDGVRPDPVDRDPNDRPGVPMMGQRSFATTPPLDRQEPTVEVLVGVEVAGLTPVFGTTLPPRGLSGVIRRRAYKIPEHRADRWMLLLLGDRVDIWESRIRRHPVLAIAAVGAIGWLVTRRRR